MTGKELSWDDTEKLGIALCKQHPQLDPEKVALKDVHRLVTLLTELKGAPTDFDQRRLEAIRSSWKREFLDLTQ